MQLVVGLIGLWILCDVHQALLVLVDKKNESILSLLIHQPAQQA
jgi:hypothetical protein